MSLADKVQDKSDVRREFGSKAPASVNKRATDGVLLALCATFEGKSHNSQSTMALGIFEKGPAKVVLVALQAGAKPNPAALDALVTHASYVDYKVQFVPPELVPPAPGLHAEMMIVRALMLFGLVNPHAINKSAKAINLRVVCPEKYVCPDCAGYLRKHEIPHYPPPCGTASPNWVNPRTGACFRATTHEVTYYNKLGHKPLGSPVDSRAGNLGPLERVDGPA
jgi:hypothetical protein